MTMTTISTTDSPEAVTAAMGDLAKPVESKETTPEAQTEVEASPESGGEAVATEGDETTELEASPENEETEELEAKDESEKPKKKGGFQKKLERQKRENAQLAQEKEFWRLEALKAQQSKGPAKEPETRSTESKPKSTDYETHEAYMDARDEWVKKQAIDELRKEQKEQSAKSQVENQNKAYQTKINDFKKSHPDFDDYAEILNEVKIPIMVDQAVVTSELSAEITYELIKNEDEFRRICSLDPVSAAKEIGKIEARLSKPKSSTEKKTTSAPDPVIPVRAKGGGVKKDIYDPNLSFKDYERLRDEQSKAARR